MASRGMPFGIRLAIARNKALVSGMMDNYIYRKVKGGYNYIIAPRFSGKTFATSILESMDEYHVINCLFPPLGNAKPKGLKNRKIVFDEFECLPIVMQADILSQFSRFKKAQWLFISTRRNVDLGLNDDLTATFRSLVGEGRLKVANISEETLERIKTMRSL